jgi:hypothetical protein
MTKIWKYIEDSAKPIVVTDLQTNTVKQYPSIRAFSSMLGVTSASIGKAATSKTQVYRNRKSKNKYKIEFLKS